MYFLWDLSVSSYILHAWDARGITQSSVLLQKHKARWKMLSSLLYMSSFIEAYRWPRNRLDFVWLSFMNWYIYRGKNVNFGKNLTTRTEAVRIDFTSWQNGLPSSNQVCVQVTDQRIVLKSVLQENNKKTFLILIFLFLDIWLWIRVLFFKVLPRQTRCCFCSAPNAWITASLLPVVQSS